ncbi:MAG: hypothetical protein NZM29_00980 [Nitrospira sp.]|nr:hypothetical protein [Nitrospira sp.]
MPADFNLPDDLTELAKIAKDDHQPAARRQMALENLLPTVRELAERIASSHYVRKSMRSEFVDGALTFVWSKLPMFDPAKGRFEAWCREVLKNCLRDEIRQQKRWRRGLARPSVRPLKQRWSPDETDESLLPAKWIELRDEDQENSESDVWDVASVESRWRWGWQPADFAAPFGEADFQRIQSWSLKKRLVLLALSWLWKKIPVNIWETWVADAGLPLRFPPLEAAAYDDPSDRIACISAALGIQPNTLSQRWRRDKYLLTELKFVRELTNADSSHELMDGSLGRPPGCSRPGGTRRRTLHCCDG